MACRGCSNSDGCGCSVTGVGSINVTGNGTPITSPYVIAFDIDEEFAALTIDLTNPLSLNNPHVAVLLGNGNVVSIPLPVQDYTDIALPGNAFAFTYSSTTTNSDPGDGFLRFNSNTMTAVSNIYVDDQEIRGTNVVYWLESFNPGSRVRLYSRSDPTKWVDFQLVSVTDYIGYTKLAVTYVNHYGTLTNNIGDTALDFVAAGLTGATGATGSFASAQTIEIVTGAYTLDIGDVGKYLRAGNASAFTITVPLNSAVAFSIGSHIDIIQTLAGQITFAGSAGVTINSSPGLKLTGQWSGATLVKVASDTWDLVGNLTS